MDTRKRFSSRFVTDSQANGVPALPPAPATAATTGQELSVADLQGGHTYWRALYYFNLYRLLLGTGLVTLAVTDSTFALLGRAHPNLFIAASSGMLLLAAVSLITITIGWPAFRTQAYLQFALDAVLVTTLSHACGGVESGMNLLLVASVAAGGVVLSGRMSLFFAAFATVLALAQHAFETLLLPGGEYPAAFVQVGLLGIGYFTTGGIVYWLARRFHIAEAAAQARAMTTARLDRLNEAIVSKSTVGITVISKDKHCRLMNNQARYMLGLEAETKVPPRDFVETSLHEASRCNTFSFDYRSPATRIRVQGLRIDEQEDEVALFLEDLAQTEREARNLKLAALGRLIASVAHEIRNPLEAISHAGQLLAESSELSGQNRKLTGIIENQSNRINTIVTSILQLGRPGSVHRVRLELGPWMDKFCEYFNSSRGVAKAIDTEGGARLSAWVDPDQLNQIMTNLCENALRHTRHLEERPLITVRCFVAPRQGAVCMDVLDRGAGVPEPIRDKIFEPFFTTNHYGLGLGLFLARELAQNNQGELDYVTENGSGRFRLVLENGNSTMARDPAPEGLLSAGRG
ncbi:MAG: ATP-binding protein [Arenicellales bacterium]